MKRDRAARTLVLIIGRRCWSRSCGRSRSLWGLLTSFKTERDVLAYPPIVIFEPTLAQLPRGAVRRRHDPAEPLVEPHRRQRSTTLLTMLFAIPAAYALARLDFPAKRARASTCWRRRCCRRSGLIIPYYLLLQTIGWLDTYSGLVVIYLTFSLPFAIWLMVSYFEDIPREMEEAALLDRAGRLRDAAVRDPAAGARRHRGDRRSSCSSTPGTSSCSPSCSAATRVRPVTVAMFNFISVEQTLWAKLAAAAMHRDGAGHPARPARAAPHRQGTDRRRGQGRRTAMSAVGTRPPARHRQAPRRVHGAARHRPRDRAGRVLRAARPLGLRQDDDAAHPRRPRAGRRAAACCSTARDVTRRRAGRARRRDGVPELRALSAHDGGREHRASRCDGRHARGRDRARGARRPRRRCTSTTCSTAARASSPAASSSAARWRARSCASRACSCSTSRCPTSTPSCGSRRASSSRSCSARSASPRSTSPTTRRRR